MKLPREGWSYEEHQRLLEIIEEQDVNLPMSDEERNLAKQRHQAYKEWKKTKQTKPTERK